MLLTSGGERPGVLPVMHRTAPATKNYPSPHVNGAQAEKPRASPLHAMIPNISYQGPEIW